MQDYKSLDPYAPVKPLDVLAEEIGCKIEDLVKLDANENLYGPVPEVRRHRQKFEFSVHQL